MSGTVYIVLFRGVGGATQLPVKPLREALTKAGFRNVATYINSGNAVLLSDKKAGEIAEKVAAIAKKEFGFDKDIMIVSRAGWAKLVRENPFPEAVDAPTTLHVFVLDQALSKEAIAALEAKATGTERFVVKGRALYLHAPDGLGRSKFAPKIETTLKIPMTARNWNTVLKLGEMADNLSDP